MTNIHKAAREALEALDLWLDPECQSRDARTARVIRTHQALATLRAALDEAPGDERDERAAFEDWIAPTLRNGSHLNRSRVNQVYTDNRVAAKWAAWQARAMLAARPSAQTVALTDPATVELAWLEGWLQFADECVGVECCGHGVRGECCGNPDPVTRNPSEVIEAMAQRHRVLTSMLSEKGKEGGA